MNINYTDHTGRVQTLSHEELQAVQCTGRNSWEHYAAAKDPSEPAPFLTEQIIDMLLRPGKVAPSAQQWVSDAPVNGTRAPKEGALHWLRGYHADGAGVCGCGIPYRNGESYGARRFQQMTMHPRVCQGCRIAFLLHYKDQPMPDSGK